MKKGFTLIEIVCVIAISCIVMSICYPNIKNVMNDIKLNESSYLLVNDLRYSKMYAVYKNFGEVKVRFMSDGDSEKYNSYLIYCPAQVDKMKIKRVTLPKGIYVSKCDSTFSDGIITFRNNGSVQPACTIILNDEDTGNKRKVTLTIGYTRIMEKNR